ncbi:unnamed protein product [Echinostoma caproni]|uniref:Aminopeptidase n=1 Tax=Echinostoma caproni TaxID=27848 RepID=A0A183A693_9TREM|nr:unnamed protein product [Echinostoma caproni]
MVEWVEIESPLGHYIYHASIEICLKTNTRTVIDYNELLNLATVKQWAQPEELIDPPEFWKTFVETELTTIATKPSLSAHFTYGELACALRLDALTNSHPIEVEVSSPDEIDEIFDTISYCKGSSLIHMVHAFLGDKAFREGLCTYLAKHAYANATTEDLWIALGASSRVDVASIMRPWTRTAGFPVVTVQPQSIQDGRLLVSLKQQQYRLPSSDSSSTSDAQLWPVPVVFVCSSEDNKHHITHKHVLHMAEEVVQIPLTWPASSLNECLVRINTDATGFYHVRYAEDQLSRLITHMKSTKWSTASRFAFINDGFALAKAGMISISHWLSLLPKLMEGEESYSIWRCVLVDGLATYVRRIVHESDIPDKLYHQFLRKIAVPVLDKLDFFADKQSTPSIALTHDTHLLRSLLISTVGAEAGDPNVIAEANRRYTAHKSGEAVLPSDLRAAVYSTVVRHGPSEVVEELMQAYRAAKCPEERADILSALGGAHVTRPYTSASGGVGDLTGTGARSQLEQVLAFCLDPKGPVRDQDRIHGLSVCASWSAPARQTTWKTIKSDWPRLSDVYHGQFLLAHLIKGVLCGFANEESIADAKVSCVS